MAANDTVLLTVAGNVLGQAHVHTLHFRYLSGTENEGALIDIWRNQCRTAYRALFGDQTLPVQLLTARQVCGTLPLRAPSESAEPSGSQAGTRLSVGDLLPSFVAHVVSVRTASAGRSRRGRFYVSCLAEADVNGNAIGASPIARMQTYADALLNNFTGGGAIASGYQLVVHSRLLAQPGVQCQNSSTPVTGLLVRSAPATMRSRKLGSGG